MKNLTNKKLNQLTLLASTLPKLQRKNTDGTKMFRAASKRIIGRDLPDSYKRKNDWLPDVYYTLKYEEPVLVDHKLNLVEAYQQYGERGVEDYVASLNKFVDKYGKPISKTNNLAMSIWAKLKSCFKKAAFQSNQNQTN